MLADLIRKVESSEQASLNSRKEGEKARDYYDGRQLTSTEIAALKKRRQPIVIENLIRPKVDYLRGLERQTRTDPKAYPRTATHSDDADAVTDALRYVADDQRFDIKRSAVFDNILIEGMGAIEIGVARVRGAIDPQITHIPWDRLFHDPHSARPDFSDAQFLGFYTWMDDAAARQRWPDNDDKFDKTFASVGVGDTYDDKPRNSVWCDSARKRVCIVTIYTIKSGAWHRCVFTRGGELEPCEPSPYLNEDGEPECAIIAASAYIDRDNDRYGPVRDWITLQDEVNKRRSKFLHLSNSRQVRIGRAFEGSAERARAELNRPDGVLIADMGEVEILNTGDMAAGHFNLLAEAKEAIRNTGPNATLQGKAGEGQSGRAILALQQGGMTEMAPLLDSLRDFNLRCYRSIWNRIRQFWQEERWVRVTDDEKNVRFVGLNVTRAHMAMKKVADAVNDNELDQATGREYAQQIAMDPEMQAPANVLAEMDVDIQIDEVADAPTLQIEQFEQLARIAPMAPKEYIPTIFEMMIEASNLRNKDKLRKIMEEKKQPAQPDPMQELAVADAQANIEKTNSEAMRNVATAEATAARSQLDEVRAGFETGMAA